MKRLHLPNQAALTSGLSGSLMVGLLTLLPGSLPATAQVRLAPLFLEEQVERGRAQGVITLTNITEQPIRVRLYAEPFTYQRDGFVSLEGSPVDLSPYLQFSPREVEIGPGREQRIRLLGTFPPSLAEGEYRAVVFAEELVPQTESNNSIALRARVGSTVYMRQGELSADLSGQSAQAIANGQSVDLIVANQGEATVRPKVKWQLHQGEQEIAAGETGEQTVVAQNDRLYSLSLPASLPSGSYTLSGELYWSMLGEEASERFNLPVLVP